MSAFVVGKSTFATATLEDATVATAGVGSGSLAFRGSAAPNGVGKGALVFGGSAAGTATLFDPATIAGLAVRLESTNITGVASGGNVSAWPDSSGNGYQAIPRSSYEPVLTPGVFANGIPGVNFNGTGNLYIDTYPITGDDFTVFTVFATNGALQGANDTAYYNTPGLVNCEVPGVVDDWGTSIGEYGLYLGGTGNPDGVCAPDLTGIVSTSNPTVTTFQRVQSTGSYFSRINGVQRASNTGQNTATLNAPTYVDIGGVGGGGGPWFNGSIAAVLMYNSALTSAEISFVEQWLAKKYGAPIEGRLPRYIFAGYCEDDPFGLAYGTPWLIGSEDLENWFALNDGAPMFDPATQSQICRDPSIFYNTNDSHWYVCNTVAGGGSNPAPTSTQFAVWKSPDGATWTYVAGVTPSGTTPTDVWAPEWFVDSAGGIHVLVAISYNDNSTFTLAELHPTDGTFTVWSSIVTITTTGITDDIGPIDPFLIEINGVYHLFFTNGTNVGQVYHATSTSPFSGYGSAVACPWTNSDHWEGTCVIAKPGGGWRIFGDYDSLGIQYVDTDDPALATGFSAPVVVETANLPVPSWGPVRHGTVVDTMPVPGAVGSLVFGGSAQGTLHLPGHGTGSLAFAGAANGTEVYGGAGTGALVFAGNAIPSTGAWPALQPLLGESLFYSIENSDQAPYAPVASFGPLTSSITSSGFSASGNPTSTPTSTNAMCNWTAPLPVGWASITVYVTCTGGFGGLWLGGDDDGVSTMSAVFDYSYNGSTVGYEGQYWEGIGYYGSQLISNVAVAGTSGWLRFDNALNCYVSSDGSTWTKVGQVTSLPTSPARFGVVVDHWGSPGATLDVTFSELSVGMALDGVGSGQLSLAGSASGVAHASSSTAGAGSGTLTFAGSAHGALDGKGTGTLVLSGTAKGAYGAKGAGSLVFAGSGHGALVAKGSGALSLSGSASGTALAAGVGAGSGTLTFSGAANGALVAKGSGALSLSGTATGTAKTPLVGSGSGTLTFAGSGHGALDGKGSGNLSLSGAGLVLLNYSAKGTGALRFSGAAKAGRRRLPTVGFIPA